MQRAVDYHFPVPLNVHVCSWSMTSWTELWLTLHRRLKVTEDFLFVLKVLLILICIYLFSYFSSRKPVFQVLSNCHNFFCDAIETGGWREVLRGAIECF